MRDVVLIVSHAMRKCPILHLTYVPSCTHDEMRTEIMKVSTLRSINNHT